MKRQTAAPLIRALSPCLFFVLAGIPLPAETLLYEGFDMEPGVLDNKSGETSFGWRMDGGEQVTWWAWEQDEPGFSLYHGVTAEGLSYPGIESVGGAFEFRDEAQQGNNVVHRFIPGFLSYFGTSGQRWVSVLMNAQIDGDPEGGGWFQFTFSDSIAQHNSIYMGISNNATRDQTVWSAGGERLYENGVRGEKWSTSDVPVVDGETVFLVMKLDFDTKTVAWWVNPDPHAEDPGDPVAEFTMVTDLAVDRVMLWVSNNGPSQLQDEPDFEGQGLGADYTGTRIDEIRMGTTYRSIAPVGTPIVTHPEDSEVLEGQDAFFTVEVEDPSATQFRWQTSFDDGVTFGNITDSGQFSGAFTGSLTILNVSSFFHGLRVRAEITVDGVSYASEPAKLNVAVPAVPVFSAHPQSVIVEEGGSAFFTVEASGVPAPEFRWEVSADGGDTFEALHEEPPFSGTHTAELTVSSVSLEMDGLRFRAVAENPEGFAASEAAILSVTPGPAAPVILADPESRRVAEGSEASFNVSALAHPPPSYRWQMSLDEGETFGDITDSSSGGNLFRDTGTAELRILSAVPMLNGARFRVRVQNTVGTVFSEPATLDLVPVTFEAWLDTTGVPVDRRGREDRNGPLNLTNFEAYGMGLAPLTAVHDDLPRVEQSNNGAGRVVFRYSLNTNAIDVNVEVQRSADFVEWSPAVPVEEHVVWEDDGVEGREAVFNVNGDMPLFLRVGIEPPYWDPGTPPGS